MLLQMLDTVRILSQDAVALPATQYQALDHRSEHMFISNNFLLPSSKILNMPDKFVKLAVLVRVGDYNPALSRFILIFKSLRE